MKFRHYKNKYNLKKFSSIHTFQFTKMKTIFLSKIRASLILLVILFTINFKSLAIDVTIGTSTSNGSTNVIPAYGYYDYGWSAMLYSHNEIGSAGTITSLQFQQSNSVNYTL